VTGQGNSWDWEPGKWESKRRGSEIASLQPPGKRLLKHTLSPVFGLGPVFGPSGPNPDRTEDRKGQKLGPKTGPKGLGPVRSGPVQAGLRSGPGLDHLMNTPISSRVAYLGRIFSTTQSLYLISPSMQPTDHISTASTWLLANNSIQALNFRSFAMAEPVSHQVAWYFDYFQRKEARVRPNERCYT